MNACLIPYFIYIYPSIYRLLGYHLHEFSFFLLFSLPPPSIYQSISPFIAADNYIGVFYQFLVALHIYYDIGWDVYCEYALLLLWVVNYRSNPLFPLFLDV